VELLTDLYSFMLMYLNQHSATIVELYLNQHSATIVEWFTANVC